MYNFKEDWCFRTGFRDSDESCRQWPVDGNVGSSNRAQSPLRADGKLLAYPNADTQLGFTGFLSNSWLF